MNINLKNSKKKKKYLDDNKTFEIWRYLGHDGMFF